MVQSHYLTSPINAQSPGLKATGGSNLFKCDHVHPCEVSDNSLIFAPFWNVQLVRVKEKPGDSPLGLCVREGGGRGSAEERATVLRAQLRDPQR